MQRFADMITDPDSDPRQDPPTQGDERETLEGFLRWLRDTLEVKCSGLDAADLARRAGELPDPVRTTASVVLTRYRPR